MEDPPGSRSKVDETEPSGAEQPAETPQTEEPRDGGRAASAGPSGKAQGEAGAEPPPLVAQGPGRGAELPESAEQAGVEPRAAPSLASAPCPELTPLEKEQQTSRGSARSQDAASDTATGKKFVKHRTLLLYKGCFVFPSTWLWLLAAFPLPFSSGLCIFHLKVTLKMAIEKHNLRYLTVKIERPTYHKPFLGGFKHRITGVEFHNAGSQTLPKKRPDKGIEVFCRETQTVFEKNKLQQTINTTSTQMTKIGLYVSNMTDRIMRPGKYITADEYHKRRLEAVIVLQTYFRRWHAINLVQNLREKKRLRLEWEAQDELRKKKEKEEKLQSEYRRKLNPRTKEDYELLYRALEVWRQEETERINKSLTGTQRKAALCGLLEQEAKLIASIGRYKLDTDEENRQKTILRFLGKCAEPKRWKAFDGKITEMDTQHTLRARELLEIYRSISMNEIPKEERIDVLLTLRRTVKEHDCKLTQEIVELIDREVDLMMRDVKECNLEGLRKRICTLFLQYIKTPKFNPEVARILKVPPDPLQLYKNVNFCRSCRNYLASSEFAVPASSRTVGRCRLCCQVDNEARKREAFLKYRLMLKNLRESEADYEDDAKIVYLIQQEDMQYMVEKIWDCQSALSACDDLYDLVMARWDKHHEWSPWNTILLTKDEADAHLKLCNLQEAYEAVFIHRIKRKHIQAKKYFAQIPEMASFLHRSGDQADTNECLIAKPISGTKA
uniref:IQ motif and ubiquitin domain containing n=1 Tax=Nothoprocta perdicaria TaxID=30464 RepID=A0A8C6YLB5_NOTPE